MRKWPVSNKTRPLRSMTRSSCFCGPREPNQTPRTLAKRQRGKTERSSSWDNSAREHAATCLVGFGSVCGRHYRLAVDKTVLERYRTLLLWEQIVQSLAWSLPVRSCKSTVLQWDIVTNTKNNNKRKQKQRVSLPCGVYVSLVRAAWVKSCEFDPNLEIVLIWHKPHKKSRILVLVPS